MNGYFSFGDVARTAEDVKMGYVNLGKAILLDGSITPPPVSPVIEGVRAAPVLTVGATAYPLAATKAGQGMKDSTKIVLGLGIAGILWLMLKKK